ncbi:serine/threonine-protein kinase [Mycolicibacterium sediminis]|uniref:non-specific serine/threonine protein kinase n=1 Tax=Mycolicibacterium sediminis TaxID=1286180 RepID=A0A7I7QJT9_9MYCO|nr:serine/threonine-protein kinase [Mycolicibacterium sediminis]BBY26535.1 serine/threonine-protein kinase PknF [Mycolicibacterium sediminis]
MPLAEGHVIAGYTIVRSIGVGGMGEVYLARHPRLPRHDALKVLAATVCADDEYRERFTREAEIAATLWHPHIVEIHDRGDVDGRLWIAMAYVEGTDAGELLKRYPSGMPTDLVVRLVTAVAQALDYAHQKGLTHRDVKPANVLLANPGVDGERIMLADFGIARRADDTSNLTGTNMTVGTVAYAAPEQLTGEKVDGRADQYALAATAYQLLTGSPPFQHSNPAVVISQHLTTAPPPIGSKRPELTSLGTVFDKALAKAPRQRFETCVQFAEALAQRVGTQGRSGPRHARVHAAPPPRSRRTAVVAGAAVLVALVVAGVAFLAFDDRRERRQVTQAEGRVTLPVVVVGADCETLGAAGRTERGAPAYCAHMPSTESALWSLYPGEITAPTIESAASDGPPVSVCMEQTGAGRDDCRDDITRENTDPAANDVPGT